MKLLLSGLCGIVLLCILTVADNITNTYLFNKEYVSSARTLTKKTGMTELIKGCNGIPAAYAQYCDNISIQRYGHLFTTVKSVKEVPQNPYIADLNRTIYLSCTTNGACGTPSTYMLQSMDSEEFQVVVVVAFAFFACSYVCYRGINRYTNL